MKIAKYIGDLIYDYECVVIPGLGGFISTEVSASVNTVTNQFAPPFKDVHFNVHLKANDGLLVNYVARNEDISFKDAKQKVDKFVHLCHNALSTGKRINFSKIGYIFFDDQQNVVFKQDISINYNADSFGLSSFVSPAIRRPDSEEKIKEVFSRKTNTVGNQKGDRSGNAKKRSDRRTLSEASSIEQMTARKKPSAVKRQLAFVFLILFAFGTYYTINNRHAMMYYWDRHKVKIPLLYNNPNDYLAANAGVLPLDKIDVSQASWLLSLFDLSENTTNLKVTDNKVGEDITAPEQDVKIIEETVVEESGNIRIDTELPINSNLKTVEAKEERLPVKKDYSTLEPNVQNSYFIIAGSFKSRSNADRLVATLEKQGYDAEVADTNSYGMYRVAYMGFGSMTEAESRLAVVRRKSNPKAWILKK